MDNSKFRGKYRISSSRLKNWDYSTNAYYFITVCIKNREHCFGEIVNGKMGLSKMGEIGQRELSKTEQMRKNVKLDEWIIMPNHVHVIIVIDNVETQCIASLPGVKPNQRIPSPSKPKWKPNQFWPQSNNLASIIRGFKIGVKKFATINNIPFQWQPRFYDHIIRNQSSLNHIRQYIIDNPKNWEIDRDNLANLYM